MAIQGGWAPPGTPTPKGSWSYDLKKGWSNPDNEDDPSGLQFLMPPGFDPKARSRGYHMVVSPRGVPAPPNLISYTPKTQEMHEPGAIAPINEVNLSLAPDDYRAVPLPSKAQPPQAAQQTLFDLGMTDYDELSTRLASALGAFSDQEDPSTMDTSQVGTGGDRRVGYGADPASDPSQVQAVYSYYISHGMTPQVASSRVDQMNAQQIAAAYQQIQSQQNSQQGYQGDTGMHLDDLPGAISGAAHGVNGALGGNPYTRGMPTQPPTSTPSPVNAGPAQPETPSPADVQTQTPAPAADESSAPAPTRAPLPPIDRSGDPTKFFQTIMPYAREFELQTGVPASITSAMAASESNYGRAPGNMLFGVKYAGTPGTRSTGPLATTEGNDLHPEMAEFEAFDTPQAAFQGFYRVLQNPRYADALKHLDDPETFVRMLNQAGYATNDHWADNVIIPLSRQALAAERSAGGPQVSSTPVYGPGGEYQGSYVDNENARTPTWVPANTGKQGGSNDNGRFGITKNGNTAVVFDSQTGAVVGQPITIQQDEQVSVAANGRVTIYDPNTKSVRVDDSHTDKGTTYVQGRGELDRNGNRIIPGTEPPPGFTTFNNALYRLPTDPNGTPTLVQQGDPDVHWQGNQGWAWQDGAYRPVAQGRETPSMLQGPGGGYTRYDPSAPEGQQTTQVTPDRAERFSVGRSVAQFNPGATQPDWYTAPPDPVSYGFQSTNRGGMVSTNPQTGAVNQVRPDQPDRQVVGDTLYEYDEGTKSYKPVLKNPGKPESLGGGWIMVPGGTDVDVPGDWRMPDEVRRRRALQREAGSAAGSVTDTPPVSGEPAAPWSVMGTGQDVGRGADVSPFRPPDPGMDELSRGIAPVPGGLQENTQRSRGSSLSLVAQDYPGSGIPGPMGNNDAPVDAYIDENGEVQFGSGYGRVGAAPMRPVDIPQNEVHASEPNPGYGWSDQTWGYPPGDPNHPDLPSPPSSRGITPLPYYDDSQGRSVGGGAAMPSMQEQSQMMAPPGNALGGAAEQPPGGWTPPVPPQSVVGTGNKFGQAVDMEGIHKGLDLQAVQGTPAVSPVTGTVVAVQDQPEGLGHQVVIKDDSGQTHTLSHMDQIDVQPGDQVRAGQPVGTVGSTGAGSTGPHMDYRVQGHQGEYRDPSQLAGPLAQMPTVTEAPPNGQNPGVGTGADYGFMNNGALWDPQQMMGALASGTTGLPPMYGDNDVPPAGTSTNFGIIGGAPTQGAGSPTGSTPTGSMPGGDVSAPTGAFTPISTGSPSPSSMTPPATSNPYVTGPGATAPSSSTQPGYQGPQQPGPAGAQGNAQQAQVQQQYQLGVAQIEAQKQAANQQYQLGMQQLQQQWAIHQDDNAYREEALRLENEWRQKQLDADSRQRELDRQMNLLIQGSFAQKQKFELEQSALKNPWLQQLTGMAPGWKQPGGPGSPTKPTAGIVDPQEWVPGVGIGEDNPFGSGNTGNASNTGAPDPLPLVNGGWGNAANPYAPSAPSNPSANAGTPSPTQNSPTFQTGVTSPGGAQGNAAYNPYSDMFGGSPSGGSAFVPTGQTSAVSPNGGFDPQAWQSPEQTNFDATSTPDNYGSMFHLAQQAMLGYQIPAGAKAALVAWGAAYGLDPSEMAKWKFAEAVDPNAPADPSATDQAPPLPTWEEYQSMTPFERAALRTKVMMTSTSWEDYTNQMRESWGSSGGPTQAPNMTRLAAALQTPRDYLSNTQIADTFGQTGDEYWQLQQKGWLPSQNTSVSMVA